MLITDSNVNYLIDAKDMFYRYFKAGFSVASKEIDYYGHETPVFRTNNVSDLAKVWL